MHGLRLKNPMETVALLITELRALWCMYVASYCFWVLYAITILFIMKLATGYVARVGTIVELFSDCFFSLAFASLHHHFNIHFCCVCCHLGFLLRSCSYLYFIGDCVQFSC